MQSEPVLVGNRMPFSTSEYCSFYFMISVSTNNYDTAAEELNKHYLTNSAKYETTVLHIYQTEL